MEDFKIIHPSPQLASYVRHYWILKTSSCFATSARTVPTGMMSLIFHRGNLLRAIQINELHPRAFLSGQEKTFADLEYSGQINMISVVFRPVGVRAFFNLPMLEINNLRVGAGDFQDKELATLEKLLAGTENDQLCILLIEQFLLKRLSNIPAHSQKRIEAVMERINSGETSVVSLADTACLSPKQFKRVFSEYVGANPKEYLRTIRFQRALHVLQIQPQISLTGLACECGFFDQSHLIKEFKALSGYTPGEYLAACQPHSDYFN